MVRRVVFVLVLVSSVVAPRRSGAQDAPVLPSPLTLADVIRLAGERRDEIAAARARVRAAEQRPAIVAALADPMIAPSLDHLPFTLRGADFGLAIEQQIPLPGVLGNRRASAEADIHRVQADVDRASLDAGLDAAVAFHMLQERRRMSVLVAEQVQLARDLVGAANARYASGSGPQADVLRAETEVARLMALDRVLVSEVRAAEAMLTTALALDAALPVPRLAAPNVERSAPSWPALQSALAARPELAAGRAQVARAAADVRVMRDLSRPIVTIRSGPAYTMADGYGWMAMVGVSVPIWRGKLRALVGEAEAIQAMSEADLRALARTIERDAAVALHQLHAARDRQVALAADVVPRARLAIAPALATYTAGQLPLVSVVDAIQSLWRVQAELITAETDVGLAWARLGRAIGSYEENVP